MNRQDNTDFSRRVRQEPSPEVDLLAQRLLGAAIEVHRGLGPGFLEAVYRNALCVELALRGIPYATEVPIGVSYKGHVVGKGVLDLLIDNCIVVELKAVDQLAPVHVAQILSYLRATNIGLGFLINFNMPLLQRGIRRVIRTPDPA